MSLSIELCNNAEKNVLYQYLQWYLKEYSEFDGRIPNSEGVYDYKWFDHYFSDPDRFPFMIVLNGKPIGFSLVRELDQSSYEICEFYILKNYREHGYGLKACNLIFKECSGQWKVSQDIVNKVAVSFWRNVASHFDTAYKEVVQDSEKRVEQSFLVISKS